MKLRASAAVLAATLLVCACATVSAAGEPSAASAQGDGDGLGSTSSHSTDVGVDSHESRSLPFTAIADQCVGLPRNTVLASCPAPCLADAPCIVYDQDPKRTKLTGCDYEIGTSNSFCTSDAAQTCEFHCFPLNVATEKLMFWVYFKSPSLGEPTPRTPEDPSVIATPGNAFETNDFVVSVGQLNLSKSIVHVEIIGDMDDNDSERFVDFTVDPRILANASSVAMLALWNLPLTSDRAAEILASVPAKLKELIFSYTKLDTLSWKMFASVPKLEAFTATNSLISRVSGNESTMPALTMLDLSSNKLTDFDLRAPKLLTLDLPNNKFVSVPQSVFSFSKLKILNMAGNSIIKPLVLTALQAKFLTALPALFLDLVDPPDPYIVSRLPVGENNYGNYSDDADISSLLVGGQQFFLRGDPSLPAMIVDSSKATTYNNVLDLRARFRVEPSHDSTSSPPPPLTPAPTDGDSDTGHATSCVDLPRNTLFASCPAPCLPDAPCIVYNQDVAHSNLTGCDYDTSTPSSFCSSKPAETCEFHCFPKSLYDGTFVYWVDFKAPKLETKPRTAADPSLIETPEDAYQSNDFVFTIGKLNASSAINHVQIVGGFDPGDSSQFVNAVVDPALLSRARSVRKLTLLNVPLDIDQVAAIVASSPPELSELELTRTNITSFSWKAFAPLVNLNVLLLRSNRISLIVGDDVTMPTLKELDVNWNELTGFDLKAPKLTKLYLMDNELASVPQSVFSYSKLQTLDLSGNPLIKPLVLTALQAKFLMSLSELHIDLVDPPDPYIVSRLPVGGGENYGNYFDDEDISSLLVGGGEFLLFGDPALPAIIVDNNKAATYNHLLDLRARFRVEPSDTMTSPPPTLPPSPSPSPPPLSPTPTSTDDDSVASCVDLPRNTLLASCPAPCLPDAPCIVYDQDAAHSELTACDYDTGAPNSLCFSNPTEMCEFQCFAKYDSNDTFVFWVDFKDVVLRKPRPRPALDPRRIAKPMVTFPYESSEFVFAVGKLNVSSTITAVELYAPTDSEDSSRFVEVSIDPAIFANSPSLASLTLQGLPLGNEGLAAFVASAPSSLKVLYLQRTDLTALPWKALGSFPNLDVLSLRENSISLLSEDETTMPALTELDLFTNALTGFELRAPNLVNLNLQYNQLVRIPQSVFTYSKLRSLDLYGNPIIRPLVLTALQVQFLEALPVFTTKLANPPDQYITSRLPVGAASNYGSYYDDVDISTLLEGASEVLLRGNPSLPVRVVDSEQAMVYNNLLELRARYRVEPTITLPPSPPGEIITPQGSCLDLPRNTLLASCPAPCLPDTPCLVYDQDITHSMLTGCDYDTGATESFCSSTPTEICEFHCFAKSTIEQDTFAFEIHFKAPALGNPRPRTAQDPRLISTPSGSYPYQSNEFVTFVGKLNLSEAVTTIDFIGDKQFGDNTRYVTADVDPDFLVNSPFVTSVSLRGLPMYDDQLGAIVASAPPKMKELTITNAKLSKLSWTTFASAPNLETLALVYSGISSISGNDSMPALTYLALDGNMLTTLDVRAPNLATLTLSSNPFVHIPSSVFTYRNLTSLSLLGNLLLRPLVLTAQQLQFLEALPSLSIGLLDPPDPNLIGRLPVGGGNFSNYSDDVDLSSLLVGATEALLRGDLELPVRVVDSDSAATYNDILEARGRSFFNETGADQYVYIPPDICQGVPRNTLLSYCAETCPNNGACVAFDRNAQLRRQSGCDYQNAASPASVCTTSFGAASTCEFQCFPAYEPRSQFKFFLPFKSDFGVKIKRRPDIGELEELKTTEIPFLSNSLVQSVSVLNLTSTVTEVWISGGRSEKGTTDRRADVKVDSQLLSKAPSVTSLSLLNIDLSKSDLTAILASAVSGLKALDLRNTNLKAVSESVLENLQQLESLTLAQNALTTFEAKTTTLPKLTTLDLSDNALTTFDVKLPNLKNLDLSGNNLAAIPPSVFSPTKLETLNLKNNPLALPLVLSATQASFLNALTDLHLDAVANLGATLPMPPMMAPSTTPSTAPGSPTISPGPGYVIDIGGSLVNGTVIVVGGVPAVIVDEETAKRYNDQLEQKQKESTPRPGTQSESSGGGAAGPETTSPASDSSSSRGNSESPRSAGSDHGSSSGDEGISPGESIQVSGSTIGSDLSTTRSNSTTPPGRGDTSTITTTSSASLATKLILGGVAAAFFVAILVIVIIFKRRKSDSDKESTYLAMTDSANGGSDTQSSAAQIVSWWKDDVMLSHRLNAGDITDERVIGSGGAGLILLVNYRGGSRQLLSKRVIEGEGALHDAKMLQLVAEAKIASQLRYPSIVPFVGVAWTDKTDLQVLYEYMPNGDLSSYLARTDPATLPWIPTKLQLAIDIIEALVYAHSFNPPLVHRDLKASNVLLDDDFNAKVGEFGSARPESDNNTMTTSDIGSGRWLAPEILLGSTSYGTASDIYSFGVVLCELDTRQVPYAEEAEAEGGASESELLQRVARGELRPTVSASCPPDIHAIAEACLAFDPDERPTAMAVAHLLRSLRRKIQEQ